MFASAQSPHFHPPPSALCSSAVRLQRDPVSSAQNANNGGRYLFRNSWSAGTRWYKCLSWLCTCTYTSASLSRAPVLPHVQVSVVRKGRLVPSGRTCTYTWCRLSSLRALYLYLYLCTQFRYLFLYFCLYLFTTRYTQVLEMWCVLQKPRSSGGGVG